jgi:hypothetical protein
MLLSWVCQKKRNYEIDYVVSMEKSRSNAVSSTLKVL